MRSPLFNSYFVSLFTTTILWGCVGSLAGAAVSTIGSGPKVPLGKSTGVGFLIGAGFGATFAIFRNLTM